jgi:hypothetical protein
MPQKRIETLSRIPIIVSNVLISVFFLQLLHPLRKDKHHSNEIEKMATIDWLFLIYHIF